MPCSVSNGTDVVFRRAFQDNKNKDFELEASQLETGVALKKQVIKALQVALTIILLRILLNKNEKIAAKVVFSPQQIAFIAILLKTEIEEKYNSLYLSIIGICYWYSVLPLPKRARCAMGWYEFTYQITHIK